MDSLPFLPWVVITVIPNYPFCHLTIERNIDIKTGLVRNTYTEIEMKS